MFDNLIFTLCWSESRFKHPTYQRMINEVLDYCPGAVIQNVKMHKTLLRVHYTIEVKNLTPADCNNLCRYVIGKVIP